MKKFFFVVLLISLGANVILAAFIYRDKKQEIVSTRFPFLSPRIFIENQNDILINFIPLRQALNEYIVKQEGAVGVYFEYLPSGVSIGVNDKLEVRLASLIKVPVAMAVYKQIEKKRLSKDKILTVQERDINKLFGDLWKKGTGAKISVDEALRLTLVESDNTAARVLASVLPQGAIDEVFDRLDIPKDKAGLLPVVSAKNYSLIFRSLYLSSYLTKEYANEILLILSQTGFNDKIAAGVPAQVKVSHKIGIFDQDDAERVFSDCGIFYLPKRPYILCVVMKTTNEETARKQMQYVSKMVYGYVASVKSKD